MYTYFTLRSKIGGVGHHSTRMKHQQFGKINGRYFRRIAVISAHCIFFADRSPMQCISCIYGFKAYFLDTFKIHNPNSMDKRTRSIRGRLSRMRAHIKPWEPALPRGCKVILVTGSFDYWITVEDPGVSPSSLETGVGGNQFSYKLLGRDYSFFRAIGSFILFFTKFSSFYPLLSKKGYTL